MLLLAIAGVGSGCTAHGISLPKGVYLPACSYGVLPNSQPARCMTRAEYKLEIEKSRNSRSEAVEDGGKPVDPRYKDWIP